MIHSRTSALALRCAPLPLVRIGFVGLGRRGLATLRRYQYIGGVQVTALADLSETCVALAKSVLQGWHKYEEVGDPSESWAHYSAEKLQCYVGKDAASRLIHSGEVDVVYLCTDWVSMWQWKFLLLPPWRNAGCWCARQKKRSDIAS